MMNLRPSAFTVKVATFLLIFLLSNSSFAHVQEGLATGFFSGLIHPVLGIDHFIAMVAVGLWGAWLGKPAVWILPITFPVVMALGGLLGLRAIDLPLLETGIAASALLLGILIMFGLRARLEYAALIVGFFAVFHGYAHGIEIPGAANPLAYGLGFVVSTGLLHVLGICLGLLLRWPMGEKLVRAIGGFIAATGAVFLALSLAG